MSEKPKKVNKIVLTGKSVQHTQSTPPTNDEINKYGYCLNIKPNQHIKRESYLHNDYPMIITTRSTQFYYNG
ncbi:SPVdp021 hypothetical protein [Swinepox virus]|nr:SPVdp021 hypothetical protein [Swinepox virus]